jgi:hypothetical protein
VSKNEAARRSFWLIVTRSHPRMEVLQIDAGGETVLPLFSCQEEGEFYLAHQSASVASRLRETTTGELVSLLLGLCARVDTVALDPFPRLGEREIVEAVSTGRKQFVHHLLGEVTVHSERDRPTGCEIGCSDPTRLWKGRTRPAQSVARQ